MAPIAGFRIRLLAGAIDAVFGALIALLLSGTVGTWFAGRAVVMLSIGSPDTFWRGPVPMILGIFGAFVYGLPFALFLVLLPEAVFGASTGKWLLRLVVTDRNGRPASSRRRLMRWLVKCGGVCVMVLALFLSAAQLGLMALILILVALAGFCLAIGRRSLALHDRITRTAVHSSR